MQSFPYPNISPLAYRAFYDILSNAIEGKDNVPVSAKDARNIIKIVELAREGSEKELSIPIKPGELA